MTNPRAVFLVTGFLAGVLTVWGGRMVPMVLFYGPGPLFSVAVLTAVLLTDSWLRSKLNLWRIVLAVCICAASYAGTFFSFWITWGFFPRRLLDRRSPDPIDFGLDIWIALLAAAIIAAVGVEFFLGTLTGMWRNRFFFRLALAGFITVVVTGMAGLLGHNYWTFYGVLLPLGEGLFCWVAGEQVAASHQPVIGAPPN